MASNHTIQTNTLVSENNELKQKQHSNRTREQFSGDLVVDAERDYV